MRKFFPIIGFLLLSFSSFSQNIKNLLQQSYARCQKISNGYYEMEKSMKFMDQKDTTFLSFKFYFKKIKNDSIYPVVFNYQHFYNKEYIRNVMYTGSEYVTFSRKDSTGEIMSKAKWAKTMMSRRHSDLFNFYAPFTGALYSPFPKATDYTDNRHFFKFVAKETVNTFPCFHVQVMEFPNYDTTGPIYRVESKYDYWINREDMLPVKYSVSSKVINAGDTLQEYLSWNIKKYQLNSLQNKDFKQLELTSIPRYCNLIDYTDSGKIELLKKGTIAPNWTLLSLDSEKVSLTNYKGKLTLIDFFYKSCYPCLEALPTLRALAEKYQSKGLRIVGIDPIDKGEKDLKAFLSKRKVTYPIFLDYENVAKDYHVYSYPTIYLVDKNGKIVFTKVGFGEKLEEKLEEMIKGNL